MLRRARISAVHVTTGWWPEDPHELVELQRRLAEAAPQTQPWVPVGEPLVGACFVAFAQGQAGPGHPGDRAWAGAVAWRGGEVLAEVAVAGQVPAAYAPGLLALREGPILAAAVGRLDPAPEVLLVDATGLDHPRSAGLALHLGAALDLPTVGVTHRTLTASGDPPELRRGETTPVLLDGRCVGCWVCTRTGVRAVVAHAGWRTTPDTAAATVLATSSGDARSPGPLREARRVARLARAAAWSPDAGTRSEPR